MLFAPLSADEDHGFDCTTEGGGIHEPSSDLVHRLEYVCACAQIPR
jgi:hypothetical protein